MKKYNKRYLSLRLSFFSNYALIEQCYQTDVHASLHIGSFLKSRVNAVLQTDVTCSQTLVSEEKNQKDENTGQTFWNTKAKMSPVTSHDDSVAHFLSQDALFTLNYWSQARRTKHKLTKRLINQELLELFSQWNNLIRMKAGLNISLRKHSRDIDHQA